MRYDFERISDDYLVFAKGHHDEVVARCNTATDAERVVAGLNLLTEHEGVEGLGR